MEELKRSFNIITIGAIIIDILFIIMGIFFIANPAVGAESALMIIGIILLVSGIYSIIKFIINSRSFFKFEIVYGLLSIIAGCFAIFRPLGAELLIAILVGTWLIISSAFKLPIVLTLKNHNEGSWIFDLTVVILTIILGILLLINPFKGYMVLTVYSGIMLMIYAAMDVVEQLFIRKRAKIISSYFSK